MKSSCLFVVWLSLSLPAGAAAQAAREATQDAGPAARISGAPVQEADDDADDAGAAVQQEWLPAQETAPARALLPARELGAVRPLDQPAIEAFECGQHGSQTFRDLVAEIDTLGVIVHVVTGDMAVFGTAGTTRLAGVVGHWRYLRVVLRTQMTTVERASVLAHELQHAREIGRSRADTQGAVRALYTAIGQPVAAAHDAFETAEASRTGLRVWRELLIAARETRRQATLAAPQQ